MKRRKAQLYIVYNSWKLWKIITGTLSIHSSRDTNEGKKDEKTRDFGHSIQHFSDVRTLQWYWYIIKKSRWSVSTNIRCKGILASELKKTDSNGFFNSTVTILEMIYRSASKIGTRAVAIINLIWQIFCETHL